MRNVLITGGAGLIGGELARRLSSPGTRVTIYDTAPRPTDLPRDVTYMRGDVRDGERLATAMAGRDALFHAAAALGVVACQQDEATTRDVNLQGTRTVCRTVELTPSVKLVVGLSSSEVYGEGLGRPFTEDDELRPLSAYATSKRDAEALIAELDAPGHRRTVIIRPFNVYGPAQRDDFVVMRFCRQAVNGDPLTVFGSGLQTRSFLYVSDAVEGIMRAATHPAEGPRTFNLASPETLTILGLAELVRSRAGNSSPIVHLPLGNAARDPRQEVVHRAADITRAEHALGFSPAVPLSVGVDRVLLRVANDLALVGQ